MIAVDKVRLAQDFGQAANSYDQAASFQKKIAAELLVHSHKFMGVGLDLGCGTGQLSAAMSQRGLPVVALDIATGMLQNARSRQVASHYLQADAEALPLASAQFDWVISSLAIQWCHEPARVFAEVQRVLKPGGTFLFSTLGPDTLHELRQAMVTVDGHHSLYEFAGLNEWRDAIHRESSEWAQAGLWQQPCECEFENVGAVMRALKQIGARHKAPVQKNLRGRGWLNALALAYPTQARASGRLIASYDVIYGHLQKPL
ncbi:malonyl-ACP O-methyltransferase BioC [Pokkaliibacter sp. CJK22405]|uniref:malonyl-ACP O-methyltransferase BioC n=1 Tax=Pokkaliibacter sp. CJK22405 TaxID=3384615 RepID=UPI0039846680